MASPVSDRSLVTLQEQIDILYKGSKLAVLIKDIAFPKPDPRIENIANQVLESAALITQYVGDPALTHWYIALNLLNQLGRIKITKVPLLPDNVNQILNEKCPVFDEKKEDGTFNLIRDTHVLAFFPRAYGDANYYEQNILGPSGPIAFPGEHHPLCFFRFEDRQNYIGPQSIPNEDQWGLVTIKMVPKSRGNTWEDQELLVKNLSKKAGAVYQPLTLRQAFMAATACRLAGIDLFSSPDQSLYSRVQEVKDGCHLAIGRSDSDPSSGLSVHHFPFTPSNPNVGILAVRLLK